ncbi:glycosyltransferase family 2 protein [Leptospira ryugenii]|nr:glycosyltransferase family 2 protein [Leptospira ryugenii]
MNPTKKAKPALTSMIVPIYNEASHLEEFLEKIDALKLPTDKEIVFIDDCSKDKSKEILKSFKFKSKTQIIEQEKNQGKGAALRKGIEQAKGDFIIVQDADFEYDMEEVPMLIEPLFKGKADVVFGSRFKKDGRQVHRTFHYLVNRLLTILSNFMSGLYLTDMETCYKAFKAEIIQNVNLESNRFGFEPEVTAKIARLKIRVQEFPISYYPRNYLEGKKITWKDGVAALRHIVYFNMISSEKHFFKKEMPERYIPRGGNWL